MFAMATLGVSGLNFHTAGTYTPFYFSYDGTWSAQVNPLYYAMLFYARATANRGQLLPDATFGAHAARGVNVHVWATVDSAGTVRVAILNKDLRRSGTVQIRVRRGLPSGSVIRLRAPSAFSRTGVTLAGQAFMNPTSDGQLVGQYVSSAVPRGAGETYRVSMPRLSAAILTVPRAR